MASDDGALFFHVQSRQGAWKPWTRVGRLRAAAARTYVLVAVLIAAFALAGCLDEEECGPTPDADSLAIGYGIESSAVSALSFRFDCEASEADYEIDRYTFFFRTPEIRSFQIEPDVQDLSPTDDGSATYFAKEGVSPSETRPEPPFFTLNFSRWDPALNGDGEPRLEIRRIADSEPPEFDRLPSGIYEIKVGLRSGADEGKWLDVGI